VTHAGVSRRQAITGAAAAGLAVPVLAACSSGSGETATDPSGDGGSGGGGSGSVLASTSDLVVGGAVFVDSPSVVVTEPADGEYKAFNRTCTHQGCPVQDIVDGNIHCPCHDSLFSIVDGSNVAGPRGTEPTLQPLAEVAITVDGDQIVQA
jgi:Rieske Fe-S protein